MDILFTSTYKNRDVTYVTLHQLKLAAAKKKHLYTAQLVWILYNLERATSTRAFTHT